MNHPFLHPVEPGNAQVPVCYDRLQSWIERLPSWFSNDAIPKPKATLLCGLPGSGRGDAAKAIARALTRPLYRLDPACDPFALAEILTLLGASAPSVLWIDSPGEAHVGILRWLLDRERSSTFIVGTTDEPGKLPERFLRSDIFESRWHLDLPDSWERSNLWRAAIEKDQPGYHENDFVKLALLSSRFTAGEIQMAYDRATRASGKIPDGGQVIDAVLAFRPVSHDLEESLASLRDWARLRAYPAATPSERRSTDLQ